MAVDIELITLYYNHYCFLAETFSAPLKYVLMVCSSAEHIIVWMYASLPPDAVAMPALSCQFFALAIPTIQNSIVINNTVKWWSLPPD